ncbi:transcriptional regulator [Rhizocola hellebori]|uniref:Transcriptional regulator n=1 Tax=Rhizocola hellebori TaxID=1392758 RepID=A0A8J3VLR7_9ACTN|nr:transcriptional regulator [Rhizocola hellebori]
MAQVLAVLLDDPLVERYGLELMRATGQSSGRVYPLLARLQESGWVRASWETIDSSAEGRPRRRCYRLTPEGVTVVQTELAALRVKRRPPAVDASLATDLGR